MQIVRLEAQNVMRLTAVNIAPDGNLICIGGENEAGKSSVLRCIEMALAGGESIPPKPIHGKEKTGRILLDLGEFVVERTFTALSSALTVKTKDGAKYSSPQKMLDGLVGSLSFDPMAFKSMEPKKQADTLRRLVGLDFTAIDAKRKATFDARTDVNRKVKDVQSRLSACPKHDDAPASEVIIRDVVDELARRERLNDANEAARDALKDTTDEAARLGDRVVQIKKQLAEAEKLSKAAAAKMAAETLAVAALVDADTDEIREQLQSAEETNRHVRDNLLHEKLAGELAAAEKRSTELTAELEDVDDQKASQLAAAKFPVDGLAITDDGVTYKGIPLEQCSGAQSVEVTVAMGFAMNPKLKVLLVRDPAYIGEKYLKLIARIAEENGGQVWLERGGDGKECTVIIEDGHIKADAEKGGG